MGLMRAQVDKISIRSTTIFTRKVILATSPYIRAMHPKTQIMPEPLSISRILKKGWVGQSKIHGHRAQIHISADPEDKILAYTRHGQYHKMAVPPAMAKELYRLFRPKKGWNVIDAEWLKPQKKLFVFDFLKQEGVTLRGMTYPERWALLPKNFISPCIQVLPLVKDLESCLKILSSQSSTIEGLVFKSGTSAGFSDNSIVRCRKRV